MEKVIAAVQFFNYCHDPKFLDKQVWADSADPDQKTAPRGAIYQGLHCCLFNLHHLQVSNHGRTS